MSAFGIAVGIGVRYPTYPVWCLCCVWTRLAIGLLIKAGNNAFQAAGPLNIIQADGRAGIIAASTVGLFSAALYVLVSPRAAWVSPLVTAGLCVSIVLVFVLAGGPAVGIHGLGITASTWTRYHIAVVIAAFRGKSPLRFGAFLIGPNRLDCCAYPALLTNFAIASCKIGSHQADNKDPQAVNSHRLTQC